MESVGAKVTKDIFKQKKEFRKILQKARDSFINSGPEVRNDYFIEQIDYQKQYYQNIIATIRKHSTKQKLTVSGFWPIKDKAELECDQIMTYLYSNHSAGKYSLIEIVIFINFPH